MHSKCNSIIPQTPNHNPKPPGICKASLSLGIEEKVNTDAKNISGNARGITMKGNGSTTQGMCRTRGATMLKIEKGWVHIC